MIKFESSKADLATIVKIAKRAGIAGLLTFDYQHRQLVMDLDAVKSQGCPIDLDRLLAFDSFDFAHDIAGIARHIDRHDSSPTGGQLLNCFYPRCARPMPTADEARAVKASNARFARKVERASHSGKVSS